jgi:hypothetical protein
VKATGPASIRSSSGASVRGRSWMIAFGLVIAGAALIPAQVRVAYRPAIE